MKVNQFTFFPAVFIILKGIPMNYFSSSILYSSLIASFFQVAIFCLGAVISAIIIIDYYFKRKEKYDKTKKGE